MRFNPAVYDLWLFRREGTHARFLVLRASEEKAACHFNGGRFWQVPSGVFEGDESVPEAVDRHLTRLGLVAAAVWAGEHTYTIYNRRFHEIQVISVYGVEVSGAESAPRLDPVEHSEHAWLDFEEALSRVHYRGLKDGLRSVQEYVTGVPEPAAELRLR